METLTTLLPQLLPCLLCSFLLVPCLTVLVSLAESFSRSLMLVLWKYFGNHFTWHSAGSEFASTESTAPTTGHFDCLRWALDGKQGVRPYRRGAPEEEAAVRCMFCLCDVEDGQEIRELCCEHVFHRCCLDRWVECGRVTCPLCRKSLAPSKVAGPELPCEEGAELGASVLMFVFHLHGAWWVRWQRQRRSLSLRALMNSADGVQRRGSLPLPP